MKLTPKLQADLTKLEAQLPPGAIRSAAVADCIAQALDMRGEREKLRASMRKLQAARAALTISPRAKPRAARPAPARAAKPLTAPTATRRDRRQAPLPLAGWSFGHLAHDAERGNVEALAELHRRGFARTGQNTFNRNA